MSKICNGVSARLFVVLGLTLPLVWGATADEAALQAAAQRADQLRRQGKPDEAVKEQERALHLAEELYGADDLRTAAQLDRLARLHQDAGRHARAEALLRRGLQIKEAKLGKEHADVARALHDLAALYGHTGQYAKAEPLYRRSLEVMEATLGKDHLQVAAALDDLAALYRETGQHGLALPLLQRSLEIKEARRGKEHTDVALALHNLAAIYQSMKQYAKAEPLYRRALEIKEAGLGKDHLEVAAAGDRLAALYQAMKEYSKAEPLYRRGLEIREARRGKEHPEVALALHNLAGLYQSSGEYARAEPLARRALEIKKAELGKDHPTVAAGLSTLAQLQAAQGRWQAGAGSLSEALRVTRRHSVTVLPALSEPEQLAFLHERVPHKLHLALSLALAEPGLAERAAEWLLNAKDLPAAVLAERAWLARDAGDPRRGRAARELRDVRLQLARLTFAHEPAERRELGRLSEREAELALELGRRDGRSPADDWLTLEQLRKSLPADTAFVDIACFGPFDFRANEDPWGPNRYVAWIVPPAGRGQVRLIDLGEAKKVDAAVGSLRETLAGAARPEFRQSARALADLVLTPLVPHLEKAAHWVIAPDAALWLVPWAAMPVGEMGYLIEKHRLSYAVSGRDLLRSGDGRKPSAPAILGDPDYNARPQTPERPGEAPLLVAREMTSLAGSLPRFDRLPGTARALAPPVKAYAEVEPALLLGEEATLTALQKLRAPRVLVLSAPGFFLPDVPPPPRRAGSLLRPEPRRPDNPLENPLLRSGLALAGANRRGPERERGLLTGMDAAALELRGCELVVLPASETTAGAVNKGDGVAGLRQAFQLAGARSVLASLWLAPPDDTAALLADFFAQLTKGDSRAEALRQAQLRRIGAAHPFHWAAFTLTGE